VDRTAGMSLGLAAMLLLAGMLAACEEQTRGAAADTAGSSASSTSSAPVRSAPPISADTTPSPITSPDLNDANILALLDHAHEADSSAGALASKKATSERVKEFARMMMADHHRLRRQGADLARKLSVTPMPPPDDPITPRAHGEMDALKAAERGAHFDLTYIQQEIEVHSMVLALAAETQQTAGNAELKVLIGQARPLIENHLRQARAIEQELGASPVTAVTPPRADSS
jgi:putative membrane protein